MTLCNSARLIVALAIAGGILAGCASSGRAPMEAREPSRAVGAATPTQVSAPPAVARPGYYIVKRGDTLYSIAHQFERDYREVAAWNNLSNPNVIEVGQELRVTPADSEGSRVIAPPPALESRPLDSPGLSKPIPSTSASGPLAQKGDVKTEPKGGRLPYSSQAWKDVQARAKAAVAGESAPAAMTQPVSAVSAPVAVARIEPKPAVQSAAPENKPSENKPATGGDDDVDWVWPGSGKVVATFNDSSNKGVDIGGNMGDPVLAAGPGRVVYVGSGLRGYGNLVIIKHNNSFLSAYAHNSEILVKEGQSVQKGQKIAALGNSDADRPKLHFEIRRQGKPVDPLKYLPSR